VPSLCPRRGQAVVQAMAEYLIIGAVAVGILLYLAYALLFPEKF
jgi:K+-transporting ATPase KdpF subunit